MFSITFAIIYLLTRTGTGINKAIIAQLVQRQPVLIHAMQLSIVSFKIAYIARALIIGYLQKLKGVKNILYV